MCLQSGVMFHIAWNSEALFINNYVVFTESDILTP